MLDLFLSDHFLAMEPPLSEAVFLDRSGLVGKAEAILGLFSGKKIYIKNLRLR